MATNFHEEVRFEHKRDIGSGLALGGIVMLSATPLGSSWYFLGLMLLIIGAMFVLVRERAYRSIGLTKGVLIYGAFISYILASSVIAGMHYGAEFYSNIYETGKSYVEIVVLSVVAAWVLSRNPHHFKYVAAAIALAVLIRVGLYVDPLDPIGQIRQIRRPAFGHNINIYPLPAIIAALTLLIFFGRVERLSKSAWHFYAASIAVGLVVAFILYTVLLNQTRAGWLAAAATVPLSLLFVAFGQEGKTRKVAGLLGAGVIAVAGMLMFVTEGEAVGERIVTLQSQYEAGTGSGGIRRQLIASGFEAFQKSPVFGSGVGASLPLSTDEHGGVTGRRHLHNQYIQTLAELGLVGTALLLAVVAVPMVSAWRLFKVGGVPTDVLFWLSMITIACALWALGNSQIWQVYVRWNYTLVLTGWMTLHFMYRRVSQEECLKSGSCSRGYPGTGVRSHPP
jgi:hypothetical protein